MDIVHEPLKDWMQKRGLTKKQMAREMGISYINLYHTLVARPKQTKRGKISESFIVRFSATYGVDVAAEIFPELVSRETA